MHEVGRTAAPSGGEVTSGVFPNRDNVTAPDIEQEKREQARHEHDWALGLRDEHPEFTKVSPDNIDYVAPSVEEVDVTPTDETVLVSPEAPVVGPENDGLSDPAPTDSESSDTVA